MPRKRDRRQTPSDHRGSPPRAQAGWTLLLPALVAVVLCLPDLSLGYFWDDYYFLSLREHGGYRAYLLPHPHAEFYRPISQGLYFLFLRGVDPTGGTLGHVLNVAALAGAVVLLASLVSRVCGRRAGLLSGFAFASLGVVPSLIAWISCIQDLLAVDFVLAAFLLRHDGRTIAAFACATAAVFCKEPAIAAFPVLVLWDRLLGRPASRPRFHVIAYVAAALIWALIHPGIHDLASRGFQSGLTGYLGVEHPERWGGYLIRYLMTLVNLPPHGFVASWWEDRIGYGLVALAILVAALWVADRRQPREQPVKAAPLARVAWIAVLFGLPTLLMPTLLVRPWEPYYAFIPATGFAIFLGPFLARQRPVVVLAALSVFLLLGVRYRGIRSLREHASTERLLAEADGAVRTVRANFRTIFPSFPKGSQVVVSVSSTGVRGIYSTVIWGQALRLWYQDPTLLTVPPLRRLPGATTEFLVRVTSDLDVISIDPDSHRVRAATGSAPGLAEIGATIVNYARAVAAGGDTDRAVRITQGLATEESGPDADFTRRHTAMFLFAAGRRGEAAKILATTSSLAKEDALWSVMSLLKETSSSERLDEAAFKAFGLSSSDPETIRWVMRHFRVEGALGQAAWYAQRLARLTPGDPEGIDVIRTAERMGITPRRESV